MTTQKQLIDTIKKILNKQTYFFHETKRKLDCYYYLKKGKQKKLIFYLNPQKQGIIFGIGHYGNDFQEDFPFLRSMADEAKQSVLKRKIKSIEDIENKGIAKIIELLSTLIFQKNQ